MKSIRVRLTISGQVQGVFFRQSAKEKADELGLVGWVRNTADDGGVEAVAQGEKERIDEFIAWCRQGPSFAKVENVEAKEQKGLENLTEFSII